MPTETVCPDCGGSGWKIIERAALSGAGRCDCGLGETAPPPPPRARGGGPASSPRENLFSREFPTGKHLGLLLVGEPGTGKTHLAVAALRILISRGFEGLFFDYQNLLDRT